MEKTPAACAMEWSIQLEKSLRSPKPGKSIEALEETGRRLEWWNSHSKLTVAEYRMFGLIPGEDKLFLNAIFLRLVDAFKLGNKEIKTCVVKIFLKMRKGKKSDGGGLLSKGKLDNHVELLSRVKEVFYTGDVEERALALLLFGCWAPFSKDCLDVRYILLSSLVCDDVIQVKAALFAAGCVFELSEDFANVFLEILSTTVLSQEKPKGIKLAGGRAFAKISCSFSLAEKAHKNSFTVDASNSSSELLTLFQGKERSFNMQATSLRCHRFMLGRGVCDLSSTMGTVHLLFSMLHRAELQPSLHLEALKVLYKILLYNLSIIPCMEIPELFQQLFIVVKKLLLSSTVSSRVLAVRFLADLSAKVLGRQDVVSGGSGCTLALQLSTFILDQILLLVKPEVHIHQADFAADHEVKSLLHTLLILVEKHPYLRCLVLNSISLFIDKLMKNLDSVMDTENTGSSKHNMAGFGIHDLLLPESKIIHSLSKIVVACLQNLEETDAETSQVLDVLKLQAENVCHCNFIGNYTRVTYFLILHLHSTLICMRRMIEELMPFRRGSSPYCVHSIFQLDKSTLDCVNKMLEKKSFWDSYKAGKTAVCQGAWSTGAFIFEQLMTVVQSSSFFSWLKSLAQFSNSEKQVQLLLLYDQGSGTVLTRTGIGETGALSSKINHCKYTGDLLRTCDSLLSAEETLATSEMCHIFTFQRWFLTLRVKALKTFMDMVKLLDLISSIQDSTEFGRQLARGIHCSTTTSQTLGPLIDSCMEVSCRLNKLAQEFDVLLTSFMGIDRQSVMSISAFALSCSLMAFTAGFAFLDPNLYEDYSVSKSGNSGEPFLVSLIEDLFGRLRHINCKTRENLFFLLKTLCNRNSSFMSRFKTQISSSHESIVLHKLCEYSIGEIFSLQNEAIRTGRNGDTLMHQILNRGSDLMMNIISKLMLIPFVAPRHFFQVRPAVSSELFIMNEDGQTVDGSSILSGLPLSLTLCFQLKNMPAGSPSPLNKVYCILKCKPHPSKTGLKSKLSWQDDDEVDDMLDSNEKLLRYIVGGGPQHCRSQEKDPWMVIEYVCFELNERRQGFCTCFLDVSSLPVGSYRIKWHTGCIDSGGSYWNLLPVNAGPLFTIFDAINA